MYWKMDFYCAEPLAWYMVWTRRDEEKEELQQGGEGEEPDGRPLSLHPAIWVLALACAWKSEGLRLVIGLRHRSRLVRA